MNPDKRAHLRVKLGLQSLGADAAENLRLSENGPAGLVDVLWSCDASGGAICPADTVIADIDAQIPSYPMSDLRFAICDLRLGTLCPYSV